MAVKVEKSQVLPDTYHIYDISKKFGIIPIDIWLTEAEVKELMKLFKEAGF
jgi:hypothetical protein